MELSKSMMPVKGGNMIAKPAVMPKKPAVMPKNYKNPPAPKPVNRTRSDDRDNSFIPKLYRPDDKLIGTIRDKVKGLVAPKKKDVFIAAKKKGLM